MPEGAQFVQNYMRRLRFMNEGVHSVCTVRLMCPVHESDPPQQSVCPEGLGLKLVLNVPSCD